MNEIYQLVSRFNSNVCHVRRRVSCSETLPRAHSFADVCCVALLRYLPIFRWRCAVVAVENRRSYKARIEIQENWKREERQSAAASCISAKFTFLFTFFFDAPIVAFQLSRLFWLFRVRRVPHILVLQRDTDAITAYVPEWTIQLWCSAPIISLPFPLPTSSANAGNEIKQNAYIYVRNIGLQYICTTDDKCVRSLL